MRLRLPAALATLVAALALAPAAAAAPPRPFGHSCAPVEGALYCPTASDAGRVASFDGVPLDVDVYLPLTGDGPFPTIAMLHGFGGSQADLEAGGTASTLNASFYPARLCGARADRARLRPLVRRAGLAGARLRAR